MPEARADTRTTPLEAWLVDASLGASTELSPREVAERTLQMVIAAFGARNGWARVDGSTDTPIEVALSSRGPAPMLPLEIASIFNRADEAWLPDTAVVSFAIGGGPVGSLALSFDVERELTEVERLHLRALGGILASEVDRARLRWERRLAQLDRDKKESWARALHDAFRLIASPASLDHILDELARVSCEAPADFCAIRVLSEAGDTLEFRGLYHPDPEQSALLRAALDGRVQPAALGFTAQVLATGESRLLANIDMDWLRQQYAGTPFGDFIEHHHLYTVMIVGLRARGAVLGVVTVARTTSDPFVEADLRFLEEVADRASAAIDNAMLMRRLTLSEEQLRVALEAGRLGTWNWDIAGARTTWSPMLEEIHGLAPGTFEGTESAFERDIHPDDRARVVATIAEDVAHHDEHHLTYRIVRPDREVRWIEAHGRVLRDAAGLATHLIGVCADITEQKQSEARLRETLLALRDADQRKDQFLAMLAHELRNPLGPILNATHLLSAPGVQGEVAVRAGAILNRQVTHMSRLLDDLLDVSRITRGKVELRRETVDVGALVREAVGDRVEVFQTAGLQLEVNIVGERLLVDADRARLAQVIGNLLSNAQKFSSEGHAVHVRVEPAPDRRSVVLSVRDEGVGIEPKLLKRIFEPFVQADTSLARPEGGLGLGLAVVKGLVALHGGRVDASSDGLGHGAEIRVTLPLIDTTAQEPRPEVPVPKAPAEGKVATVLVFEDNPDASESLRGLLEGAGYHVWIERTGARALERIREVRPDVILCDVGLPERDGYSIAAEIRSDAEWSTVPLIAISGYGAAEDLARSRGAGFDRHLTKPVPPSILLSELVRFLATTRRS